MTSAAALAAALRAALDAELPAAVRLRHELHAHPDLSGEEEPTTTRVAAAMDAGGCGPVVAGTGRLIRVGPPDGPAIALRAELDALPLTEQTGVSYAAAGGRMHACGHDVHLAALTALVRAARRVDLPVALLAILQPREESSPSGAQDIVSSGVLAAQGTRAVIGVHVQPLLPRHAVAATPGAVNAAADDFVITVTGRGGHGGYPHLAADPVVALAHIIVAAQQIVSRHMDPMHAAVVTIGQIESGSAPNVIPGEARACGTLRALHPADRKNLRRELSTVVSHTARAHGCRGTVHLSPGEPALVNDPALTTATQPWLRSLGLQTAPPLQSCGSDDFAYYGSAAPALMLFAGVSEPNGRAPQPGLHHPAFHPADHAVGDVARALLAGFLAATERYAPLAGAPKPSTAVSLPLATATSGTELVNSEPVHGSRSAITSGAGESPSASTPGRAAKAAAARRALARPPATATTTSRIRS